MTLTDSLKNLLDFNVNWADLVFSCLSVSFAYNVAAFTSLWVISLLFNLADVVDFYWGLGFFSLALLYSDAARAVGGLEWANFWVRPTSESLLLGMLAVWSLRLSTHIIVRSMNREFKEDERYAQQRARYGSNFWWVSFFTIFMPAAIVQWLVSVTLMFSILATYARTLALKTTYTLTPFDVLGFGVWLCGFVLEAVADWQLMAFKSKPENKDKVCTSGVWSWTRHPNHFGDALVWVGYFLTSLNMLMIPDKPIAISAFILSLASPATMIWMLKTWTGAKKLEDTVMSKREGYAEYIKTTPGFVPHVGGTHEHHAPLKQPEPAQRATARTVTPSE